MSETVKRYRRRRDGLIVEAMQYTSEVMGAQVASFILRFDVNTRVTVSNERILDVVRPLYNLWNRKTGDYPIEVTDPSSGLSFKLLMNTWLIRWGDSSLILEPPEVFVLDYVEVPTDTVQAAEDELKDLIWGVAKQRPDIDLEDWSELAAEAIIKAGWSRKE